jgi:gliding motility-associated-like protein
VKPVNATVNQRPNLVITNPSETCAPGAVDITAPTVTSGSDPGLILSYWQNAAATVPLANPASITISGQYFIKAASRQGCVSILPVNVVINPIPTLTLTAADSICAGLSTDLVLTFTGQAPWSFSYNDGSQNYFVNNILSPNYLIRVQPGQTTTYTITSLSDRFCTNRSLTNNSKRILVTRPIPGVRLKTVLTGSNTATVLQGRNLPGYSYTWTPRAGLDSYTIPAPTFSFNQQVDYRITMLSGAGCITVDSMLVRVVNAFDPNATADFLVPNAFSPNGDGKNDNYFPFAVNIKELRYFRIFNRWGQLVFETKMFGYGWDGMFKGMKQPADVYVWTAEGITVDGSNIKRTGNVLLLK